MSYITTPEYGPPSRVTCVPGYATLTTCKVLVVTLYDPTTDVVTVNVNGVDYVSGTDFTLTARGTDNPFAVANGGTGFYTYEGYEDVVAPDQACWTGLLTVTGLSAWTRYPWTVSQTVSGTTYTDSGSLKTAPNKGTRVRVEFASCDNNTNFSNQAAAPHPWTVAGYWQHMKTNAQADDLTAAVVFVDDFSYVDSKQIEDIYLSGGTGLVYCGNSALGIKSEFDYALAYCAALGMLGPETVTHADIEALSAGIIVQARIVVWGREVNRAWCRKNLNLLPQFGDHEFSNDDPGWDTPINGVSATYPNARWEDDLGTDGPGWNMWHAFFGLCQPPPIDGAADTVANHWVCEIGDMTIFTLDAITRSETPGNISPSTPTTFTTLLGTDQIEDVLTAIQGYANRWVVWGAQHSIAYLSDSLTHEYNNGAQHPIRDHVPTEFSRLFTATGQTPKSLMDSPYTNGVYGTFFSVHGDHHWGQVVYWHSDAYASNHEENFYAWQFGTINGSVNFNGPAAGTTVAGGTVLYAQTKNAEPLGNNQFHGCSATFDAQTCYVRLADWHDETKLDGTYYAGRGNRPFSGTTQPAFASISVDEEMA